MFKAIWVPYGVMLFVSALMLGLGEMGLYLKGPVGAALCMLGPPFVTMVWTVFSKLEESGDQEDLRGAVVYLCLGVCSAVLAIVTYNDGFPMLPIVLSSVIAGIFLSLGLVVGSADPRPRYLVPSVIALLPAGPLAWLWLVGSGSSLFSVHKVGLALLVLQGAACVEIAQRIRKGGLLLKDPH